MRGGHLLPQARLLVSGQDDRDNSSRLACGTVDNFGLSKDAIQIWLDVQQLINLGLTATYVRDVIEAQNRNIAHPRRQCQSKST